MKLIVNPEFEVKPEPMEPGHVHLKEMDFSEYVVPYNGTPITEKACSLRKTYLEGSWRSHVPGQLLFTSLDLNNMFNALTKATSFYVSQVQGVDIKEYKEPARKEVVGVIDALIKPNLSAGVGGHFNQHTLADAVMLRVCEDAIWLVMWNQFLSSLVFNPKQHEASKAKAVVSALLDIPPMTDDGQVPAGMEFHTPQNKSDPTLRDIYVNGVWEGHKPGQCITTLSHFNNMFEFLTHATSYYVGVVQGVPINDYKEPTREAIMTTIETRIEPCINMNAVNHFYRSALVDAVLLRACNHNAWKMAWAEFLDELMPLKDLSDDVLKVRFTDPGMFPSKGHGSIPATPPNEFMKKLEEAHQEIFDNTKKDPNVLTGEIVVPAHSAEHVELHVVIDPKGVKISESGSTNQPVPCDPPKPKPVVATKVPSVDAATGKLIESPGPGWRIGDDFCWHPPIEKVEGEFEKVEGVSSTMYSPDLWKMVTALDHPSAMVEELTKSAMTKGCALSEERAKKLEFDLVAHGQAKVDKKTGELVDHKVLDTYLAPGEQITVATPHTPTHLDDVTLGFKVGNVWHDQSTGMLYGCMDNAMGAAKWVPVCGADGGPVSLGPTQSKNILVPYKPKHIADLEQQEVEEIKQMLDEPISATYTGNGGRQNIDLQKFFSPQAEKDLAQAMSDQVKMDLQDELEKEIMAGNALAKDKLVMAPPVITDMMSDVTAAQKMLNEVTKIPPHLMHGSVQNTK